MVRSPDVRDEPTWGEGKVRGTVGYAQRVPGCQGATALPSWSSRGPPLGRLRSLESSCAAQVGCRSALGRMRWWRLSTWSSEEGEGQFLL